MIIRAILIWRTAPASTAAVPACRRPRRRQDHHGGTSDQGVDHSRRPGALSHHRTGKPCRAEGFLLRRPNSKKPPIFIETNLRKPGRCPMAGQIRRNPPGLPRVPRLGSRSYLLGQPSQIGGSRIERGQSAGGYSDHPPESRPAGLAGFAASRRAEITTLHEVLWPRVPPTPPR
jgi:hypothetical protein